MASAKVLPKSIVTPDMSNRQRKLLFALVDLISIVSCRSAVDRWRRFYSASDPSTKLTLIEPRSKDHEYSADHRRELLYIRTNFGGRNFCLVTAPVKRPGAPRQTSSRTARK